MKTLVFIITIFSIVQTANAQLDLPGASPEAKLEQLVGFTSVSIVYSRPSTKGRKIFGALVPFDKLWRTGASEASTIKFSEPVKLNGNNIPAGNYSLFSIPGATEWTIILNKDSSMHGTSEYKEENDLIRFKAPSEAAARFYESFTIDISDIAKNDANLYIIWENTQVKMRLESNADERVMGEINDRINVKKEDKAGLYIQSARYYFENGKDLKQALEWANKAVAKDQDFNYIHLLAKIQAANGEFKAAIESAKKSSELANLKKMDDVVKANDKLIEGWAKNVK